MPFAEGPRNLLLRLLLPLLSLQSCNSLGTTITFNQSIKDGDFLISKNKAFVLGFFSPGTSSNRYVGIWYKFSQNKVLWVANRDNPVNDTSGILTISTEGNLILLHNNSQGLLLWSTNVSVTPVSNNSTMVQLLDSGNLVLVNQPINNQSGVLWQSFDHPTHIILANMKIGLEQGKNIVITSWNSQNDPGTGSCSIKTEPNGSPQIILYKNLAKWWRSGHWDGLHWNGFPNINRQSKNNSFDIVLVNNKDEVTTKFAVLDPAVIPIIEIDGSGSLQLLAWKGQQQGWVKLWSPTDVCDKYGTCGPFGVCKAYTANWVKCGCLPGYEPNSPEEWRLREGSGGCKRQQGAPSMCRNREGFVKIPNVKVPDTSTIKLDINSSMEACEQKCLNNCSCLAYASADVRNGGSGCMTWYEDLMDTTQFAQGQGQDLYIRADAIVSAKYTKKSKRFLAKKGMWLILVFPPIAMIFLIFFGCWCLRRKTKGSLRETKQYGSTTHKDLEYFDLKSILVATDNFSTANKLGEGGFGSVYKGLLANGEEIAVKRLSKNSGQGLEQFKAEVKLIAKLQHRNLVRILGCCINAEEKMLIYEYLPNKSLDFFIFGRSRSLSIDWKDRFDIINGIARGVLYLHQDSRLKIIHRDIKASNVLLDSTMNPKISDFGLAKMIGEDQIQANTNRVIGTYGYMSPEYAMEGRYSTKSDVFSFGVLLLEIISGKRNTNYNLESPSPNLIGQIWDMWREGQALGIVDPSLSSYPAHEVSRCIHIGLLCVQESTTDRPTMSEVVYMLGKETPLTSPKKPAFILQSSNPNSEAPRRGHSLNNVTITMLEALMFNMAEILIFTKALFLTTLVQIVLLWCCSASVDSITSVQPVRDGEFLVSKGEVFELGFFSPGKSTYRYVGIWYKKDMKKTVVWVANRDNPINDTSGVLTISADHGNLVLYAKNESNVHLWSTNSNVSTHADPKAQLLDTGNLVLIDKESQKVTWQSFDYPSNTLLPYMKTGVNKHTGFSWFLTSWKSEDDPGTGNCTFVMDESGAPQMILYKGDVRWWQTGNWNGIRWSWNNTRVVLSAPFIFNASYVNNQDEISSTWGHLNSSISSIMVIDDSGSIQQLTWFQENLGWKEMWSAPMDKCDYYGKCGEFGYCDSSSLSLFECQCLPGFEPKSPDKWDMRDASDGCMRKRMACHNGEGFVKKEMVKVPDMSLATMDMNLSWKECEQECLRNCSCSAYAIHGTKENVKGCMRWYGNLVDTTNFAEGGQDLYVRVDAIDLAEYTKKSRDFLSKKGMLLILVVSIALILLFVFFGCWYSKRKKKYRQMEGKHDSSTTHHDLPFFELKSLVAATDNFSDANKLGEGGFGSVYKGLLATGQEVAVKRLSKNSGQGLEQFKNEVMLIAKLQHRNLVRLFGYCIHAEEKMLIYEYLPNKSLDFFIFDRHSSSLLDWKERFEIIIGVARGILYLHQDSRLKIIHRDLKASNALLDSTMNPKISDFGLAKMFGEDQIQATTNRVIGTYGYMSPEYAMEGRYSTKSDVFSYGVLLLEIISGKRATVYDTQDPSPNLIGQIWDMWTENTALSIVDPSLGQSYPAHEVSRCIQIGLLCVQESASDRPSMSAVVSMLGNETPLHSPKKPAFILQSSNPNSAASSGAPASLNDLTITMPEAR
ncbi:uncharacterized protein LOC112166064 [Rosa chinensis]|uniref:uncharacterized protein LOC112166064 n=1 Tax=Rosa chinensis TaxID=74649 RepID=UPI001AD92400|nr:uncharacterized protein LOC112166064 [Rosa chinensis]